MVKTNTQGQGQACILHKHFHFASIHQVVNIDREEEDQVTMAGLVNLHTVGSLWEVEDLGIQNLS